MPFSSFLLVGSVKTSFRVINKVHYESMTAEVPGDFLTDGKSEL